MKLSLFAAFVFTIFTGILLFLLRAFPFLVFSKKDPPAIIRFIEKYIPSMIIAILIVYCLKDIQFASAPFGLPSIVGIAATVGLHLWRNNAMVSIFGGTIIYMILNHVM